MEIENVYPITLKKKEYKLWDNSPYISKAVMDNNHDNILEILKKYIRIIMEKEHHAICIAVGLEDFMIEKLLEQFPNNNVYKVFKQIGTVIVRPGAAVFSINKKEESDMIRLLEYWGSLDGIQIIFPIENHADDTIELVCTDDYIYKRHDFYIWDKIMQNAKIVITDTSRGGEFELVYHKREKDTHDAILLDLIDPLCNGKE